MEEMDPTPRFEIAQHRPLGKITPFRGKLDESKNSIQWLRGFAHTPPNEWCMAFPLSLRDGAVHWHRVLSRKTKRTWSLLSDKFISYYCSQFSQSASTPYYRAKRSEKEHIRYYLNRLNGYARSANIKFERSGREAKEHVKHFFGNLHDTRTLEDIVSDIQEVEKRVSNRSSSQIRVEVMNATTVAVAVKREAEPRHTSRVALVDASVTDLITELQTRDPSERHNIYSNDYSNDDPIDFYEGDKADQDACDSDWGSKGKIQGDDTYYDQDERLVAAPNDNECRNAANGTFARSDKRPQNNGQQSSGFGQNGSRPMSQSGSRFNDNRGGRSFQRPSYGPCAACGGHNHSMHFCFRRYRLCQQVHDFSKCAAFDELAKMLRTNVDTKNISPGLRKLVFGGHLTPPRYEANLVCTDYFSHA
ncbi:hypothetical protein PHMEG_00033530 [Phytophthora megakarya]|uniref:Retrotransposon gag domain-containing protein n=1 Tax=Phytophthora megakarya TaxID=4795 RepID=A0A225UTC8_9STRA|nr:hypothetical protein PHMEG_00033530 [Phytophthora megakarya]